LTAVASASVFFVACAVTAAVLVRRFRARSLPSLPTLLVAGLLATHLAGSYVIQVSHASGYGMYNWRYFLPSTAAVALVLALGVVSLGRASAIALPGLVMVLAAFNVGGFLVYGLEHAELDVDPRSVLSAARALAVHNGVPELLPAGCLAVALAALVGLGVLVARNRQLFAPALDSSPEAA
jgi:hypothetical protein